MDPAGPESIVFVYIFLQFLPNKDGSGLLQLGQHFKNMNSYELSLIHDSFMNIHE